MLTKTTIARVLVTTSKRVKMKNHMEINTSVYKGTFTDFATTRMRRATPAVVGRCPPLL